MFSTKPAGTREKGGKGNAMPRERRRLKMLITKEMTAKEHVGGHYKVTEMPWATDHV
jgi:hypothetical protein